MELKTLIFLVILLYLLYNAYQISVFKINRVCLTSKKIKGELKILQISDFHDSRYVNKSRVLRAVSSLTPHITVLTGDMIDGRTVSFQNVIGFMSELRKECPRVYFVCGNHELKNKNGKEFISEIKNIGIKVLDDSNEIINLNENKINVCGMNFPSSEKAYARALHNVDESSYTILLSHSPSNPVKYGKGGEDLILSGHTHGGQVRIPFLGAAVVPEGSSLRLYDKGVFKLGKTALHVDSGLGNSVFPIRLFNRVQISIITVTGK